MTNRFKYLQSPLMMNALCPVETNISEGVDLDTAIQEAREFSEKRNDHWAGFLYHDGQRYFLKDGVIHQ